MDKNAIKKYAVWARRELIERVSQKALQYGISADGKADPNADNVNGKLLTDVEKKQRQALIRKINEQGYEQVMEEVAYTWFNRFAALRFMEVNGYLPSHVRVFTNDDGEFKPQILSEAIHLEMDGLKMEKVYELKNENKNEELFKYLLITQCNALSSILPGMFQKIEDYTELLLPDNLLREGSVIEQMVNQKDGIPESDWTDQVQIIGWLYQYYNTEPKDKVFADLKKNIKITKETIPAATQLFTPDWIVHYMVENSLGRLWLEGHPNDALKSEWKYYLDEAEQDAEVQKQLDEIRKEYAKLKPEEIRCIDPCMGSGHILCVLFDTLVRIYEDYGYTAREAAASIVENNLWGLDIDERAAQLSYFAVMMKARQYDRRFFSRGIQPHVYAIEESNGIDSHCVEYFADSRSELRSAVSTLLKEMHDAKEYGSIINVTSVDFDVLYTRFDEIKKITEPNFYSYQTIDELLPFVRVAQILAQKYHVVVTNPPYAGAKGINSTLKDYLNKNYKFGKFDLFAAFILRCEEYISYGGIVGLITPNAFFYNPSYASLRSHYVGLMNIISSVELGSDAFESGFGTAMYVSRKGNGVTKYMAPFFDVSENVDKLSFANSRRYISSSYFFSDYESCKFMYKLNANYRHILDIAYPLSEIGEPRIGMQTNDNNRFVREWFEIEHEKFNCSFNGCGQFPDAKWFPMVKGGGYRKWYGNIRSVVNWEYNGKEIKDANVGAAGGRIVAEEHYFHEGLTWTHTTYSQPFSIRLMPEGTLINVEGPAIFNCDTNKWYMLACLNSVVGMDIFTKVASSIHFSASELSGFPVILAPSETINMITKECVRLSKNDWDSFETSWDFQSHPLAPMSYERQEQLGAGMNSEERRKAVTLLSERYRRWEQECEYRFSELKKNEEELNRIFIDIYGLQDELTPEVEDKDVTVRKADLQRDIRSLISYAVGCMFGRYSLDVPGLAYAGGEWDMSKYTTFQPDKDAIIPICDDEYFEDDIVGRFVTFIEVVYGRETLQENLQFIAQALGGKGTSREVIRNYFISDFYKNHCKVYQKRPIYWLFDSGRKNGFKCLVYLHRYQPDTIARIRTDYVHEQQSRYRTAITDLEQCLNGASTAERVKLNKKLQRVQAQAAEIREYEEKIHHLADQMIRIDLDDGVRHNYEIFKDVLAKIK